MKPAFLLSMPRAGSTLLQRLLAAHTEVATVAEPWFLLPPLYALRREGVYSEYGHQTTFKAVAGLYEQLPEGRSDYLAAVASMAQTLYERLAPPGSKVFLDKTPRYGLVADDLVAAFPEATFIALYRNPLAVVSSISSTFDQGGWKPYRHKQDLYLLPERLIATHEENPDAIVKVRYEDLLSEPEPVLRRLLSAMGLAWEDGLMESFANVSVSGSVGDPTGVEDYDRLSNEPLTKWRENLSTPVRKAWARRYLRWLGPERLAFMGYELDHLMAELDETPNTFAGLIGDTINTVKGIAWSIAEVESARAKLRALPRWNRLFTHS